MADKRRVLIVEDERPLAHALDLKLTGSGCETVVARDGKECLELLENQNFDVVLMDLMMPEIDGFHVLAELQKKGSMPTVFVLSNLNQPEDEQRVKDLGAAKFFVKSNTPLAVIVEEVLKA